MKKFVLLVTLVIITASVLAQVPQKMSYQAVVRNSSNSLVVNSSIGMRVSVLQGNIDGTAIYTEIYNPNPVTNANGLISIEIGGGVAITGTFSDINWELGPYFIKTEIDPNGGTNYTITGTSQLLSVPYSFYAGHANKVSGIDEGNIDNWNTSFSWGNHADQGYLTSFIELDPLFSASTASGISEADTARWNNKSDFSGDFNDLTNKPVKISDLIMDAGSTRIFNLSEPVDLSDAVTKSYVSLRVSVTGDSLLLGPSQFIIIPGLSSANPYIAPGDPVTDVDGNEYPSIIIGAQTWMLENLKTTKYRNGTPINYPGTDNDAWASNTTGAYAWYDNDMGWKDSYGALYNWYAVNNSSGLCPTGWRIPAKDDWDQLVLYLDPTANLGAPTNISLIAGAMLKSTRTQPEPHPRWDAPNNATNSSGFSAFPGGSRYSLNGSFSSIGTSAFFWTATQNGTTDAWANELKAEEYYYKISIPVRYGVSVRCIKD